MRIVHTEIKDSPPFSAPEAMLLIVCYFPQGERWFLRWGDPQVIFGTISPLVYELQMQMHQNSRWRYRGICFPFSSWNGWLVMWLENKNVDLSYCYISQELFRFCCLIFFTSLLLDVITDSSVFHITLRYIAQILIQTLHFSLKCSILYIWMHNSVSVPRAYLVWSRITALHLVSYSQPAL